MSLSLLLQKCPACLVFLTWITFVIGVGGCAASVLWRVASRTSSIQLANFSCIFRQAISPYLASIWCIHILISTWPLLGKKTAFFLSVRSHYHMTHSLSIAVHSFASRMLCHSLLIRRCNRGRLTCPLVWKDHRFVCKCRLFDQSICIVLSVFIWSTMPAAARSRKCSKN